MQIHRAIAVSTDSSHPVPAADVRAHLDVPSRESPPDVAQMLLTEYGHTFAEEAGIRLRDTPMPLYQLLVLTVLSSTRISARIAVAASRELTAAGLRTPQAMAQADWQHVVDVLDHARYVRYDESTATALDRGARFIRTRWHGDLRGLRAEAGRDPARIRGLLQWHERIGPVGADIFCREAQGVWPELRPAFDGRALAEAERLGLPRSPEALAACVPESQLPRLAAALVRSALHHRHRSTRAQHGSAA
jgi:hypothetical protein